jgi:hypothetical protein
MADLGDLSGWDDVEAATPLDPLPPGPYTLTIIESDAEHLDAAEGRRVNVTFEVQTGPHAGRKGWARFDIDRVSRWTDRQTGEPKEGQIGLRQYKALCIALGLERAPRDTTEMHGILFQASAKVKQLDRGPVNEWDGYRPVQNGRQPTPAPAQRQPAQAQARQPVAAAAQPQRGAAWPARRA